jgi:hypothetical protein
MIDNQSSVDDVPQVVIEPPKPNQPREKQYFVLQPFELGKLKAKTNTIVLLTEAKAIPYISARFLIPLEVALREKRATQFTESKIEKIVETLTGEEIITSPAPSVASTGKSFLGNKLRDAIQAKKPDTPPKSKIDLDKLAAIKSGGKK